MTRDPDEFQSGTGNGKASGSASSDPNAKPATIDASMMDTHWNLATVAGTLTGAALNLREHGGGEVAVVNANARNQQLLSSLGLDHILDVDREGTKFATERKTICEELGDCGQPVDPCCKADQAQHVLEAHEALTRANRENLTRFRDVIDFLEKEVSAQITQRC